VVGHVNESGDGVCGSHGGHDDQGRVPREGVCEQGEHDGNGDARGSGTLVCIGSHSRRFAAIDAGSGRVVWEYITPDRIEASAALVGDGRFIAVGCFDGALHVVNARSGEAHWVVQTGDTVKSCAALHGPSGAAIFGSHDGRVRAVDVVTRQCLWSYPAGDDASAVAVREDPHQPLQRHALNNAQPLVARGQSEASAHQPLQRHALNNAQPRVARGQSEASAQSGGHENAGRPTPVLSSPAVDDARGRVVFADLRGVVSCLSLARASNAPLLLWSRDLQHPVFSSVAMGPNGCVIVATVGARLHCLDGASGATLWEFETLAPVFSSPFVDPIEGSVFVGCHDHNMCVAPADLVICA
jgi:outer membrane protein assembly factor BamB